jgi:uncharacterized OB-fold protein
MSEVWNTCSFGRNVSRILRRRWVDISGQPDLPVDSFPVPDLLAVDVVGATADGLPTLRGCQCRSCGRLAFPSRGRCNECQQPTDQDIALPNEGIVYAFSTVHISSSRPTPYTLGFVDLPGDLRVLSEIFGDVAELQVGDAVVMAVQGEGTWGFRRKS